MTKSDDRILETLDHADIALSPKVIAHNTGYENNTISKRLTRLRQAELVERVAPGLYVIDDLGQAYLRGTLERDIDRP